MNYGMYVWSAYAIAFAVLLWNSVLPYWQHRRLKRVLKNQHE